VGDLVSISAHVGFYSTALRSQVPVLT